MVTFDSAVRGTQTTEWEAAEQFSGLRPFDWSGIECVAVVAAHPDDETLGAGGLIAECSLRRIPVTVIVVTDGSASHPGSSTMPPSELATLRERELRLAISALAPGAEVVTLGYPDGRTEQCRGAIAVSLGVQLPDGAAIVAPWRGDGHRDHRVVGEVCAQLARDCNRRLIEYPIWMWHWATPDDERVPWDTSVALSLSDSARRSKRRALSAYSSQIMGVGSTKADEAILRPDFLTNFDRQREVLIVPDQAAAGPKTEAYFDALYTKNPDPWRLATRWYEARKRAITIASLPRRRYSSALEIGCSVGELTAAVADRADQLLAVDISAAAVRAATIRTAGMSGVRVEQCDATIEFPDGPFDLVVLSEVAYYWDRISLLRVLTTVADHLVADATVVVCHWRHPVADYLLRGDEVHEIVRSGLGLTRVVAHEEADFLLDVFATRPGSVAQREGLAE